MNGTSESISRAHFAFRFPGLVLALWLTPALVQGAGIDPKLARFVSAKRDHAREIELGLTNRAPAMVWKFFDAAAADDWTTSTNLFARMQRASGRFEGGRQFLLEPALQSPIWSPITEVLGAQEQFHIWESKWLHRFGREIIGSIPPGSIYFGGTDPGRFVISALCESHREGKPFFTVTQNALADTTYLDYLRTMYGSKIYTPSKEDNQRVFSDYVKDAQARLDAGQLKPGEEVRMVDNRMQVSGQVAVMQINALLATVIFDKNPGRRFFVEESFPLDWMYPHLVPHGLIMEIKPTPQSSLPGQVVNKDQAFWKKLVAEIAGDWLTESTTVREVCDFTEKIYQRKDLDRFTGDKAFVQNDEAQKCFGKLRSAIAGLYAWRADHAQDNQQRERMRQAADFAFRQAVTLCPRSPEAVFRYSNLLIQCGRPADALLIAQMLSRLSPEDTSARDLLKRLREMQ